MPDLDERWVHYYADQCCADGCIHVDDEDQTHLDVDHGTTKHIVDTHNFIVQYGGLEAIRNCIELGVAAQFASPVVPKGEHFSPMQHADSKLSEAFCDLISEAGIEGPT